VRLPLLAAAAALFATWAPAAWAASGVTGVSITSQTPAGTHGGVAFVRTQGTVSGTIEAGEPVVGLEKLTAAGPYRYAAAFELIAPVAGQARVVVFDSENRGGPSSYRHLDGFLQRHGTAYARVQWQTGVARDVPADAQGVGLVIVRDFGRWLAGRAPGAEIAGGALSPPAFPKMIITGISQSGWFVNTFLAEGFNEDPVTKGPVFDGAIAIDGGGGWLAINALGARVGAPQAPYIINDFRPLRRQGIMRRPMSDPVYVDIVNFTDFYRLRAGATSRFSSPPKFRRYEWPSPHAVGGPGPWPANCNGGKPMTTNPISYSPYFRAVIMGMQRSIGVEGVTGRVLPPSTVFSLGGEPQPSEFFNASPIVRSPAPIVDNHGFPLGGTRFVEADLPLGQPKPIVVPPALTDSINNTCANRGGWTPYTAKELNELYGSKAKYLVRYAAAVDALIAQGWLLAEDKAAMVLAAGKAWPSR